MSSEREVSLASGRQVYSHLDRSKYEVKAIFLDQEGRLWDIPQKLVVQNTTADIFVRLDKEARRIPYEALKEEIDFAFIALHGKYGDDGTIQGLLELLAIPYTGSGVLASALCMDKPMAHLLLNTSGVATAREIVVHDYQWAKDQVAVRERIQNAIGLPCVIKPSREGSSVGVSVVKNLDEIGPALEEAFRWDTSALVEEKIPGLEFSCIVLGNQELTPMPPTETVATHEYLTYDDKYMPGRSQKITPARVPPETLRHIQEEVMKAYRILGLVNYGRIDGFLLDGGKVLITDPNTSSGMAPSSFMFHQAAEIGLTASQIFDRIIELALEAHQAKRGPL
ncbi:MAG: D-alanine--D-alanine ligase [Chloroflexi bacterium]|nr:D-alanine--D-alanine ligase [Chloroflexota bacterium]